MSDHATKHRSSRISGAAANMSDHEAAALFYCEIIHRFFPSNPSRRISCLQIVAADLAGDVEHFSGEKQPGMQARHHRFRIDFFEADTSGCYFAAIDRNFPDFSKS